MKQRWVSTGELELIAATRAMLGVGLGLLVADRLTRHERRVAGWTLFSIGALSTFPIIIRVFGKDPSRENVKRGASEQPFTETEYQNRPHVRTGFE